MAIKDEAATAEATGDERDREAATEPVVHGGDADPLGGGVVELEESDEVSEGEPNQDAGTPDDR